MIIRMSIALFLSKLNSTCVRTFSIVAILSRATDVLVVAFIKMYRITGRS